MTQLFSVYDARVAALDTVLFVVDGRVHRLGLLQALGAYRGLQIVARKETCAALRAFLAVHLALWLPAVEQSHEKIPMQFRIINLTIPCYHIDMQIYHPPPELAHVRGKPASRAQDKGRHCY